MNLSLLTAFINRLSTRTKLISVAVIAFLIGTFFGGRGGNEGTGRYVPFGNANKLATLDTRNGQIWIVEGDAENTVYRKGPKIPYW